MTVGDSPGGNGYWRVRDPRSAPTEGVKRIQKKGGGGVYFGL